MATSSQPFTSTSPFIAPHDEVLEPDDDWKSNMRSTIEHGLSSMVEDAKKNLNESLEKAPVDEESRILISEEHSETMRNIRCLAQEQFENALERERMERRWAAGISVDPKWAAVLAKEQQGIMDNIKKDDGQSERSQSRASNGADRSQDQIHARSSTPTSRPDRETGYFPSTSRQDPMDGFINGGIMSDTVEDRRHSHGESGTTSSQVPPDHWKSSPSAVAGSEGISHHRYVGHNTNNRRGPSTGSMGRGTGDDMAERPRKASFESQGFLSSQKRSADQWHFDQPLVDEPEEMAPLHSLEEPMAPTSRPTLASPAKPFVPPELWATSGEDTAYSRTYLKARRASNANMASSYRSSGINHISERPTDLTGNAERERTSIMAAEQQWKPMDKAREREKQGPTRIERRQNTASEENHRVQERLSSPTQTSEGRHTPPANKSIHPPLVDDYLHSTPSPRGWPGPSRSPNPSSSLRSQFSKQNLRYSPKDSPSFSRNEGEDSEDSDLEGDEMEARMTEIARQQEDSKWHDAKLRQMQEDARKKEAEIRVREEHIKRREEELERKRKEEEVRRKVEEIKKKEEELKRREEELNRREAESRRKEEENRRQEEQRKRKEAESRLKEEESRRRDAEKQRVQQDEFRRREEDIRRRADERKRQDSVESTDSHRWASTSAPMPAPAGPAPWSTSNRSGSIPIGTSPPSTDRSSTGSSSRGSTASSWSASSRTTTSTQASSSSRASTTPTGSSKPATPTPRPSGSTGKAAFSEAEWARRQEEQAREQQEKFRKEQERQERERQAKEGRMMTKDEILRMFDAHDRQWSRIPTLDVLHWDSFPWPMLKRPIEPDDLTPFAIESYVLSPFSDKTKSEKDRIKDHIKRWHPDRFETKLLPKVIEKEREKVKEGAGSVVRALNSFLTRPKDSLFS